LLTHLESPLGDYDLQIIDLLAKRNPLRTISTVIAVILGDDNQGPALGNLWLQDAKILSRLAAATSPEDVVRKIEEVPADRWRELVAHVSFSLNQPDLCQGTLGTAQ
jgi:hypothetical protein